MAGDELLRTIDAYFDAVPRSDADAFEVGPFTLFVGRRAWSYYARPRRGLDAPISSADIEALEAACREREARLAVEWVGELAPSLEPRARAAGLVVESHVLLALAPADLRPVDPPQGSSIEIPVGEDPLLVEARAVTDVAFGVGGDSIGGEGVTARDARLAEIDATMRANLAYRSMQGLTVTAVAIDERGAQSAGSLQPAGDVAEIVGVGTLPAARRRGLAAAVSHELVDQARRRGLRLVTVAAQSESVARVYERLGFRRVGTHLAAAH